MPTTCAYLLEPVDGGTRLTVRHEGFGEDVEICRLHAVDWETSLDLLARYLAGASGAMDGGLTSR